MITKFTSEHCSPGHPDFVCDSIGEAIVDFAVDNDSHARVGVDGVIKNNQLTLAGEITTSSPIPFKAIAKDVVKHIGYTPENSPEFNHSNLEVRTIFTGQSADIALGVDPSDRGSEGAGDIGMMYGGAVKEAPDFTAHSHYLARLISFKVYNHGFPWARPDQKTQVTINYKNGVPVSVDTVVVCISHASDKPLVEIRQEVKAFVDKILSQYQEETGLTHEDYTLLVNPTGMFSIFGPVSDAGCIGRKIVADQYGGFFPVGGGSLCISEGSLVSTPEGLIPIEDLGTVDMVSVKSNSHPLSALHDNGEKTCYEITTSDGYKLESTKEHQIKVPALGGFEFVPVSRLVVGNYLCIDKQSIEGTHTHIEKAYMLGMLLADGEILEDGNYILRSESQELLKDIILSELSIEADIKEVKKDGTVEYSAMVDSVILSNAVNKANLTKTGERYKRVPRSLFTCTSAIRESFLRAVFDSSKSFLSFTEDQQISIETISPAIGWLNDIQLLLLSSGIVSSISRDEFTDLLVLQIKGKQNIEKFLSRIMKEDTPLVTRNEEKLQVLQDNIDTCKNNDFIPGVADLVHNEFKNSEALRSFIEGTNEELYSKLQSYEIATERTMFLTRDEVMLITSCPELSIQVDDALEEAMEYYYSAIKRIECSKTRSVWDLTVSDVSEYVANGIAVHNCGKDSTKVDRSGVYRARQVAKHIVATGLATFCQIQVSYVIGKIDPVSIHVQTNNTNTIPMEEIYSIVNQYSFRVGDIIEEYGLKDKDRVFKYRDLGMYGHIGDRFNGLVLPWEQPLK